MHFIDASPWARVSFRVGQFVDSPGRANGLLCVPQVPVPWMVWVDSMFCLSFRPCSTWRPLETRRAIPFPIPQRNAPHRSLRTPIVPTLSSAGTVPLRPRLRPCPLFRTRTSRTTTYPSPCFLVCFLFVLFVSRSYRVLPPLLVQPRWVRGCICTPPPLPFPPCKGGAPAPFGVQLVLPKKDPLPPRRRDEGNVCSSSCRGRGKDVCRCATRDGEETRGRRKERDAKKMHGDEDRRRDERNERERKRGGVRPRTTPPAVDGGVAASNERKKGTKRGETMGRKAETWDVLTMWNDTMTGPDV